MAQGAIRTATVTTVVTAMALLGVLLAAPAQAQPLNPSAETLALRLINEERAARGLSRLTRNFQMVRHARDWSAVMASRGHIEHRPDLAVVVDGNFRLLADNVGMTKLQGATPAALARRLHKSFMASQGHRYHILGDYKMAGVGIFRSSDGAMWMTINFLKGRRDGFPVYSDIRSDKVERRVGRLYQRGVIEGCGGNRYCPKRASSRAELARSLENATGNRQASSVMAAGCSTRSCTTESVTRAEAARMVAAALDLDPVGGRQFTDVARADRGAVNAVVHAGLMSGCRTSKFCPGGTITRARLAALVQRALR